MRPIFRAGSSPRVVSRYTVARDTRMSAATSSTVSISKGDVSARTMIIPTNHGRLCASVGNTGYFGRIRQVVEQVKGSRPLELLTLSDYATLKLHSDESALISKQSFLGIEPISGQGPRSGFSVAINKEAEQSMWIIASSGRTRIALAIVSVLLSGLLGIIDYYSGPDFSIGVLYIVPISVATWYVGYQCGTVVSLVCAAMWFYCLHLQLPWEIDQHPLIITWNFVDGLGIFLAQVYTITCLRSMLQNESKAARTDSLTDSHNARSFYSLAKYAVQELRQTGAPCTFLYLDVDNFKTVNDTYGHPEGDKLLRTIADTARANLRAGDELARLGGDEFAILLPQAGSSDAQEIANRLRRKLILATKAAGWPVTFSIGMCTYLSIPSDFEKIVQEADDLMYIVKKSGKNGIRHQIHTGLDEVQLVENIVEPQPLGMRQGEPGETPVVCTQKASPMSSARAVASVP